MSVEEFCLKQGVPVNEFNKWYRDTHKRIHPIHVDGMPSPEPKEDASQQQGSGRRNTFIAVTICMDNGLQIRQGYRHAMRLQPSSSDSKADDA